MHRTTLVLLTTTVVALSACGGDDDAAEPAPTTTIARTTTTTVVEESTLGTALAGLEISLEVEPIVLTGGEMTSTLHIDNNTGHAIIDPACNLVNTSVALIPVDDPDAELWMRTITDCGGEFEFPDGYSHDGSGPRFLARTATGENLPPGKYLAAVEFVGYPERLTAPVTVGDSDR